MGSTTPASSPVSSWPSAIIAAITVVFTSSRGMSSAVQAAV
ncbi:hypothetical protein [Pseudonocardia yuanmonensis]